MNKQSNAMQLAQALLDGAGLDTQWDAAKELRRLHEEIQRLSALVRAQQITIDKLEKNT